MRVMLFSEDVETVKLLRSVFETNFRKMKLDTGETIKESIDKMLCGDFEYQIAIIDLGIKSPIDVLFDEVTDLLEDFPVIFWGSHQSFKNRIPDNINSINPASGFIFAPFILNDFIFLMKNALDWIQDLEMRERSIDLDKNDCVAVKIKNFYRFDQMNYDVYLEQGDGKFLRVITKGEKFPQSLVQRYARLGTKELFLQKEMRVKFLDEAVNDLLRILSDGISDTGLIYHTQIAGSCIVHEYIRTIGICKNIIKLCEKIVEVTHEVYKTKHSIRDILRDYPLVDGDLAEQSILTAYICEALLKGIGWSSDLSRVKLGLASIIHDCPLENCDLQKIVSLKDPSIIKFTEEEIRSYCKHPKIAAEVAKHFTNHTEIDFVIAQHHELPNGTGFPEGLNAHQIPTLSCIFILSNNFVKELINCDWTPITIRAIFSSFREKYNTGNFRDPLVALEKLFD
jgi:hypothetical protein